MRTQKRLWNYLAKKIYCAILSNLTSPSYRRKKPELFPCTPSIVILTFDADGGTCAVYSQTVSNEIKISLPKATRSGYAFEGWYNGADKVEVGASFTVDTTLVAKWTAMVATADELNAAIAQGGSIRLTDDITLDDTPTNSNKITKSVVIDGDGHKITTGEFNFKVARLVADYSNITVSFINIEIDCDAVGVYVYPEISETIEISTEH